MGRLEVAPNLPHQKTTDSVIALLLARNAGKQTLLIDMPKDDEGLWNYVKDHWGIEIPREVHPDCVTRGHVSPFKAFADAYFVRVDTALWLGSRGLSGKTFMLALLAITEQVTLGAGVALIGGSREQSQLAHEYLKKFWELDNAPRYLLLTEPTKREIQLSNGGSSFVHAASTRSARGAHRPRLMLDEADEFDVDRIANPPKIKVLDDAMGQPMEQEGAGGVTVIPQTVISSTHHKANGPVTLLLKRISEGELDATKYEWCYKETMRRPHPTERGDDGELVTIGWLSPDEVGRMRGRMNSMQFRIEVELQEPSVEGRAIDSDAVDFLFNEEWGTYAGVRGEYLEFPCCDIYVIAQRRYALDPTAEEPRPCVQHQYVTGADWGRKRDLTAIVTYRVDIPAGPEGSGIGAGTWVLVAFEIDNKKDWPILTEKFNARVRRFPGLAAHDATGLGDVVASMITVPCTEVILSGGPTGVRTALFNDYIAAIEAHAMTGPRVESAYYTHYYLTDDALWGAGHPPDDFIAGALANSRRTNLHDMGVGIGGSVGAGPLDGIV